VSSLEASAITFVCVFGSALLGMWLRTVLPEHHLNDESKDVVKLGVGLIGTMTALLLGLLVASAKSSYDARSNELTQMAANTILLDRLLAHYGSETGEIRGMLKFGVAQWIDQVWSAGEGGGGASSQTGREIIFDKIQELAPHTEAQRALQSQAESIAISVGQMRWLLFEQSGSSLSTTFLVVVVFWLSILFVSFGLFAPRNLTVVVALLVSAISVAGAIFLILELGRPFSGSIQISSTPLRNALAVLGR
jgi:hypothetical protein